MTISTSTTDRIYWRILNTHLVKTRDNKRSRIGRMVKIYIWLTFKTGKTLAVFLPYLSVVRQVKLDSYIYQRHSDGINTFRFS